MSIQCNSNRNHCCRHNKKNNHCNHGARHCHNNDICRHINELFIDNINVRKHHSQSPNNHYSPHYSPHHSPHHHYSPRYSPYRHCHSTNPTRTNAHFVYYDAVTAQTVLSTQNVKFNVNSVKSNDISHNEVTNNDSITLMRSGIYKICFVLTLEPPSDPSVVAEHTFCLYVNGTQHLSSKFGTGQFNNTVTPCQLAGSAIVNVTSDNSIIQLKNIGSSESILAKTLDSNTIVGASLDIMRIC